MRTLQQQNAGVRRYTALLSQYNAEKARGVFRASDLTPQEWMNGRVLLEEDDFAAALAEASHSPIKAIKQLQKQLEERSEEPERRLRVVLDVSKNNKPIARLLLPKE